MQATTFTDALRFADAVRPVIEVDPARCSILATVLDQAIGGHLRQAAFWYLITDDDRPVAAAMQTPPFNLFIAPVPDGVRTTRSARWPARWLRPATNCPA